MERSRIRRPRSEVLLELRRRELRRERQEFGGRIRWEAVFFGLLAAVGLAACLTAMVLGGLVAVGVTSSYEDAEGVVDQMTAGGGTIAVAILALSYLTGGYVAARMARFDGGRQGLGIWLLSLLVVLAAAITAWIAGGQLDPTDSISLPSNPVDEGPLHEGAAVIGPLVIVVTLVAALIGGLLATASTALSIGLEPRSSRRHPARIPKANRSARTRLNPRRCTMETGRPGRGSRGRPPERKVRVGAKCPALS